MDNLTQDDYPRLDDSKFFNCPVCHQPTMASGFKANKKSTDRTYECREGHRFKTTEVCRPAAFITYQGRTLSVEQWAEDTGISTMALYHRRRRSKNPDDWFRTKNSKLHGKRSTLDRATTEAGTTSIIDNGKGFRIPEGLAAQVREQEDAG